MKEAIYTYKYQGGSLSVNDPTYVEREADEELYSSLKAGKFCYVLNSRQMGKSSLRVRTMQRLQGDNIACAAIDLTATGSQVTSEQWYKGIAYRLFRNFGRSIQVDWKQWWKERDFLSGVQRLSEIIDEVLLESIADNIVIFIDEIDSVIGLDFPTDDFFAFIRSCYNQRADNSKYNRLTFCLLGVATPSTLIEDKRRTPFNIGQAIELKGFKLASAKLSLIKGLVDKVDNPEKVLSEVLSWTGGQPFLTQKLCQLVVDTGNRNPEISKLVKTDIIENWEARDEPEHLKTIRDRLLHDKQRSVVLLELYQRIYSEGEIETTNSYEEVELRLSGLVVKQQSRLKIANCIYGEVFNQEWIDKQLNSFWFVQQEWQELDVESRLPISTTYLAKLLGCCLALSIICGVSLASAYYLSGSEIWIKKFGEYGSLLKFIRSTFVITTYYYMIGVVWRKEFFEILLGKSKSAKRCRYVWVFHSAIVLGILLNQIFIVAPQQLQAEYLNQQQSFRDYYLPYILFFPYTFILHILVAVPFGIVSIYTAFQDYNQSLQITTKLNYRLKTIEKNINLFGQNKDSIINIIKQNHTKYSWLFIKNIVPYKTILIIIEVLRLFEVNYGFKTMLASGQRWTIFTYFLTFICCFFIIIWNLSHYQQVLTNTSYCLSKLQADTSKFEADNNVFQVVKKIITCQFDVYLIVALVILNVLNLFTS
ncbi:MAG: AAA-like domain-containing protein [Cyanobacteria bacterium J06643_5]